MVKRENYESSGEISIKSSPASSPSPDDPEYQPQTPPSEKRNPSNGTGQSKNRSRSNTSSKASKARWSPEEDAILIGVMEKILKEQIWPQIKIDGRLIGRGSYGVQYHALMLLRQGTGKAPATSKASPNK